MNEKSSLCSLWETAPKSVTLGTFESNTLGGIHKNLMDILATQLWDTPLNTLHGAKHIPIPWFSFPKGGICWIPRRVYRTAMFVFETSPIAESKFPPHEQCLLALLVAWKVPQIPEELAETVICFFLFPAIRFLTHPFGEMNEFHKFHKYAL